MIKISKANIFSRPSIFAKFSVFRTLFRQKKTCKRTLCSYCISFSIVQRRFLSSLSLTLIHSIFDIFPFCFFFFWGGGNRLPLERKNTQLCCIVQRGLKFVRASQVTDAAVWEMKSLVCCLLSWKTDSSFLNFVCTVS